MIESDHPGTMFSGISSMVGRKYYTKMVKEWFARCERRKNVPTFHFALDETGANGDYKENILHGCVDEPHMDRNEKDGRDGMISGQVIR